MHIFEVWQSIHYKPGIYDPTVIGWIITVAYFVAAFLCVWVGFVEKKWKKNSVKPANSLLWFGTALVLFILGINKQLDLIQTLVLLLGRGIARENGWYSIRGEIQFAFVVLAAMCALLVFAGMIWRIRRGWRQYWLVLLGLAFVIGFLAIRTASFNDVDYPLSQWRVIGHLRMKYVLELAGVLMVGAGAFQNYFFGRRIKKK